MNTRPCAACRHLDSRIAGDHTAFCWARYVWVDHDGTVADCDKVERADGKSPPGRVHFAGEEG
jgi:hypothetical protein